MPAPHTDSPDNPRYSYDWALSVVRQLEEKYPRATEIEMEVFSLSERELAAFLAHGDRFWPFFRGQVHILAKNMEVIRSERVCIEARRRGTIDRIHTVSSPDLRERVVKRLTSLGASGTLEEQAKKGAVAPSGTPDDAAAVLISPPRVIEDAGVQYLLEFE